MSAAKCAVEIAPRVLLTTGGSGPFGERTNDAKIWTLERHAPGLTLSTPPEREATRTDIDLGPAPSGSPALAFVVDGVVSVDMSGIPLPDGGGDDDGQLGPGAGIALAIRAGAVHRASRARARARVRSRGVVFTCEDPRAAR